MPYLQEKSHLSQKPQASFFSQVRIPSWVACPFEIIYWPREDNLICLRLIHLHWNGYWGINHHIHYGNLILHSIMAPTTSYWSNWHQRYKSLGHAWTGRRVNNWGTREHDSARVREWGGGEETLLFGEEFESLSSWSWGEVLCPPSRKTWCNLPKLMKKREKKFSVEVIQVRGSCGSILLARTEINVQTLRQGV